MTAENNGSGPPPEGEDDPFAYLYRQEGSAGATAQQPGVPRRSYNQVRTVGERQYGGPPAQPPTVPAQQPNAHYAAPETMPGGRAAARHPGGPASGTGRGARRSRNGLLIGAIAVVAAVVAGIGAAIVFNDDGGKAQAQENTGGSDKGQDAGGQGRGGGKDKDEPAPPAGQLPRKDAADATLAGGAAPADDVAKAQGKGGRYVGGMNQPGASVTWTMKNIPKGGKYTVFLRYGVPGEDANSTLTVNGKKIPRPVSMKNFSGAKKGDWEAGWTKTFAWVDLDKGRNRVQIACGGGNKCNFNLDQLWLKKGWVEN